MTDTNWQGQKGLSAECKLDGMIALAIVMSPDEHPCDRCNIDRKECRGFNPKPSHAEKLAEFANGIDQ